jgi:hypothetical protein
VAVAAISLLAASGAQAATKYASTSGAGDCSSPAQSCSLTSAIAAAGVGDDVLVAPGTYPRGSTTLGIYTPGVHVHGPAGGPKPVITSSANPGVQLNNGGVEISDLRIEHSVASTETALYLANDAKASRLEVVSQGVACSLFGTGPVIRDSLCIGGSDAYDSGLGVYVGSAATVNVRNVTAIGNHGLYTGTSTPAGYTATTDIRNSILRGTFSDVTTFNAGPADTTTVNAQTSNYDSISETLTGGSNVPPPGSGSNQDAAPLFVNEAGGDYRQAVGSPTVDAGAVDSLTGTADVDGVPRPQGAAIDIGAYELVPPVPDAAPETYIDAGPRRRTHSKKATFRFSSDDPSATFECKRDAKPAKPCTSPLKLKRLKKGRHVLAVRATDAAGNADPTPATYRWKVERKK